MASGLRDQEAESAAGGVWLIAGPTASGKSELALALAERWGAEIVNADALQLYRDLRIITARPTPQDEARARHHLYGVAGPDEVWSVGRWLRAALPVLDDIARRGRPALVTGGAGLYFSALTRGLADIPPVPAAVSEGLAARWEAAGEAGVRAQLRAVDPAAEARILPGDRQRLLRAWAVHEATGRPLSDWRQDTRPLLPPGSWRGVVLEPERSALYARCDARALAMARGGGPQEALALLSRAPPPGRGVAQAIGLAAFARAARGEAGLEEVVAAAAQETRRYAKRQSTWFRNQLADWPRLRGAGLEARLGELAGLQTPR